MTAVDLAARLRELMSEIGMDLVHQFDGLSPEDQGAVARYLYGAKHHWLQGFWIEDDEAKGEAKRAEFKAQLAQAGIVYAHKTQHPLDESNPPKIHLRDCPRLGLDETPAELIALGYSGWAALTPQATQALLLTPRSGGEPSRWKFADCCSLGAGGDAR